eukprot:6542780-Ditylum_brightwellii.AAC.2
MEVGLDGGDENPAAGGDPGEHAVQTQVYVKKTAPVDSASFDDSTGLDDSTGFDEVSNDDDADANHSEPTEADRCLSCSSAL